MTTKTPTNRLLSAAPIMNDLFGSGMASDAQEGRVRGVFLYCESRLLTLPVFCLSSVI